MLISWRPSTYVMGSGVNLRSFGVTGVKRSNSLKMLLFVHVTQHDHKTHTCSSGHETFYLILWGQMSMWGHFRRQSTPSLMAKFLVSSSSLFFLTICFFFHMLGWIFTKLGQKHLWVDGYKTYGFKNSPEVIWGHRGQKGQKLKNATTPSDYRVLSRDSCTCIS